MLETINYNNVDPVI